MAKAEYKLTGDFDQRVKAIEKAIAKSSFGASLTEKSDSIIGNVRLSVRVFDQYTFSRGGMLGLVITFCQAEDETIHITALTAGGDISISSIIVEDAILDKLGKIIEEMTE